MRGRVVIREHKEASGLVHLIDTRDPRGDPTVPRTHRGTVIAVGEPVLLTSGAEVPLFFKAGDVVQFHFEATEEGRKVDWDGEPCVVMAQREIDAVIE
jgi:co-chaperonin GroES (HSP10)